MRKFLRAVVMAGLAALFMVLSPSVAAAVCERPALPGDPNAGTVGNLDPVDTSMVIEDPADMDPEELRGPDPFAPGSSTTIYAEYGWGSWTVNSYHPPDQGVAGCLDDRTVTMWPDARANDIAGFTAILGALTTAAVRLLFAPTTLGFFDPGMEVLLEATGNRLFYPLIGCAVAIAAVMMMHRANKEDDVKGTARHAGIILVLAGTAMVTLLHGMTLAPKVDSAVTSLIAYAGDAVARPYEPGPGDEPVTPLPDEERPITLPDVVAANLVQHLMYEPWCTSHFGRNPEAAEAYCADLFKAAKYSRTEYAAIQSDPGFAQELRERHEDEYREVAEQIEEEFPEAYTYLSGERSSSRPWVWLMAASSMLLGAGILIVGVLMTMFSLLVVRLFIAAFPAFALYGVIPGREAAVARAFDYVTNALVQGILFCVVTLVWIAGALGALNSPSAPNTLIAFALMLLSVYGLWKLLKHFKLDSPLRKFRRKRDGVDHATADAGLPSNPADNTPGPPLEDPLPQPYSPPPPPPRYASAGQYTRGAMKGTAQAALVAGFVSGGTLTVAGAAVGAARGIAEAHAQHRATVQAPQGVPYYPATSYRTARTRPAPSLALPQPAPAPRELPEGSAPSISNLPARVASTERPATPQGQPRAVYTPPPVKSGVVLPEGTGLRDDGRGKFHLVSAPTSPGRGKKSSAVPVYMPNKEYKQ